VVEMTAQADSKDTMLSGFFAQVTTIKERLAGIRAIHKQLQQYNEEGKIAVRVAEMREVKNKMQASVHQASKEALSVKMLLENLEKDNQTALQQEGCGVGSSSERTRTGTTAGLRTTLSDIMGDFQALDARLKQEHRETVRRRVFAATGRDAESGYLDRVIDSGESENIFQTAMQNGHGQQVVATVEEIRERHDTVQQLEYSLQGLHQIFVDMAVLVDSHGDMLDNIEHQVGQAQNYVESGTTQIVDAKQSQKNTQKLKCVVLIIVLIITGIVVGVIAGVVTNARRKP